jgi:hypothetical protein
LFSALFNNTTGGGNTASGFNALFSNTTGNDNTASGVSALVSNTTGIENTASGASALVSNTTGNDNTASGVGALRFNTTGYANTASGVSALLSNVTGFGNNAVGSSALESSTGNKNIGIGYKAGINLTSGNNNIFIGNQGVGDESQTIRIGTAHEQTFIAGINTAGVNGTAVMVDANGQLGVTLSSARYKRDIAPMGTRSEKVLHLQPVTFAYKDDAQGVTRSGLIAEEVATVYPELVTRTAAGRGADGEVPGADPDAPERVAAAAAGVSTRPPAAAAGIVGGRDAAEGIGRAARSRRSPMSRPRRRPRRDADGPEQLILPPPPAASKARARIIPVPEQAARAYIARRAKPSVVPGHVKLTFTFLWLKRRHSLVILLGLLVGGVLVGCAMSPAERQAAEQAWAARDAERANRGGGGP